MIKLDLTAILYSKKNYDLEYKLHRICKNFGINLITVLDFIELTIKSIQLNPQVIFCDCSSVEFSSSNIKAFLDKNEFKSTKIIFIGDNEQTKTLKYCQADNIIVAQQCEISTLIDDMQSDLHYEKFMDFNNNLSKKDLDMDIFKLLCGIGFSAKHTGCAYLRMCIKNVVKDNCVMHSLISDLYPYIASIFQTNVANIERNIRNAIQYAWLYYGKENWYKIFHSKSLENGRKPTNREFIYMCSEIIFSQVKYNTLPAYI